MKTPSLRWEFPDARGGAAERRERRRVAHPGIGKTKGSEMPAQDRIPSSDSPHRTVLQADQARQGVTGHNVRYVLAFGLLSAIAVVGLAGFLTGVFG
jgi:hypothetical protein